MRTLGFRHFRLDSCHQTQSVDGEGLAADHRASRLCERSILCTCLDDGFGESLQCPDWRVLASELTRGVMKQSNMHSSSSALTSSCESKCERTCSAGAHGANRPSNCAPSMISESLTA
eukprot:m.163708 g.163708  ORF g.163708 m.163708 type:complete len:118 (-) comp53089_c0_seq28:773-1126(-)